MLIPGKLRTSVSGHSATSTSGLKDNRILGGVVDGEEGPGVCVGAGENGCLPEFAFQTLGTGSGKVCQDVGRESTLR